MLLTNMDQENSQIDQGSKGLNGTSQKWSKLRIVWYPIYTDNFMKTH